MQVATPCWAFQAPRSSPTISYLYGHIGVTWVSGVGSNWEMPVFNTSICDLRGGVAGVSIFWEVRGAP